MNTGNRVLWTLIGVVLLAAGVLGALTSLGRLRVPDRESALLPPELPAQWRQWGGWGTAAVLLVGLLLVVLGLLLLRAEFRPRVGASMPDLVITDRTGGRPAAAPPVRGRTRVRTAVLTRGLARDLTTLPGVRDASAYLAGGQDHPELLVRLTVDPAADLGRLHDAVDEALRRFTATTGLTPRHVDIDTRLTGREPERVH